MNNNENQSNYFADGGFVLGSVKGVETPEQQEPSKKKKKRKKNKQEEVVQETPNAEVVATPVEEMPQESPEPVKEELVATPIPEKEIIATPIEEPEHEKTPEEKEEAKKKGGIVFAVFGLVIIVLGLAAVIGILTNKEFIESVSPTNEEPTTSIRTTTERTTTTRQDPKTIVEDINYSSTAGTEILFIKEQIGRKYEYRIATLGDTAPKYGDYTCVTNTCAYFDISEDGRYIVLYDEGKYFLYDIINKKAVKDLKLPQRNYTEIKVYVSNNHIGVIVKARNNGGGIAYFDGEKQQILLNFLDYNFITTYDFLFKKGWVLTYSYMDKEYSLYDVFNNKITTKGISHMIYDENSDYYYFDNVDLYGGKSNATLLYDKDLNIIYSGTGFNVNNVIINGSDLFIYDNRNSYTFKNGKQEKRSTTYNKIIYANKEYMIVNKANNVTVVDSHDNDLGTILPYNNNLKFKEIDIFDNEVSFVVIDDTYKCDNITDDKLKEMMKGVNSPDSLDENAIKSRCVNKKQELAFRYNYDIKNKIISKAIIIEKITEKK